MNRFFLIVALIFVFSTVSRAGHMPTTGVEGCNGVYWEAYWPDTQSYCCVPGLECPFGGRAINPVTTKTDSDTVFESIFLNFYRDWNSKLF